MEWFGVCKQELADGEEVDPVNCDQDYDANLTSEPAERRQATLPKGR